LKTVLLTIEIQSEPDVVLARQRARLLAELLEFDVQDQTRISTAVSELARNAFQYGDRGRAQFWLDRDDNDQPCFFIQVSDRGAGISNLEEVLDGPYHSKTGMGVGMRGARKLMDRFRIETSSAGTVIELAKRLPARAAQRKLDIAAISARLVAQASKSPIDEVRQQNQELLRALEDLKAREEELTRVNRELSETTTGVLALYAELEDKAEALRGSSALKARFHSQMSHEVRTPINSILSISEILLNGTVATPLPQQEKPLGFIRKAAHQLSELVNDLLDLAKVEAGKMVVRREPFSVPDLFGALRGMFRPLHRNDAVTLVFEDAGHLPTLQTDEGKISQVLRNFVSNALKFTERGEVRVSAAQAADGGHVVFSVSDTGIGISPADQALLFRDFSQIESARQRAVHGTGLGLALVRDLADLLEGEVSVESEAGKGSTFRLQVPRVLGTRRERDRISSPASPASPADSASGPASGASGLHAIRLPVMVLANQLATFRSYERLLEKSRFKVLPVSSSTVARQLTDAAQLRFIIFDGDPISERSWQLIEELHGDARKRGVKLLMVSSAEHRARAEQLGVHAFVEPPIDREWLIDRMQALSADGSGAPRLILLIDDDEAARYALRTAIGDTPGAILEVDNALEGLREARLRKPAIIFLDVTMPGIDGFEVLTQLKSDPETSGIPVVINSARRLTEEEHRWLASMATPVLDKADSPSDVTPRVQDALRKAGLPSAPPGPR
jgi:signal transduction histidine kinase/DNA-binding response OmpR family regulator